MPDSSHATNGAVSSARAPRCWFYAAAAILLSIGVAAACFQKWLEGAVPRAVAAKIAAGMQEDYYDVYEDARQVIRHAEAWQKLSFSVACLAIVSCGVAMWHREKLRWSWATAIISRLVIYVVLELMMV